MNVWNKSNSQNQYQFAINKSSSKIYNIYWNEAYAKGFKFNWMALLNAISIQALLVYASILNIYCMPRNMLRTMLL